MASILPYQRPSAPLEFTGPDYLKTLANLAFVRKV